MAIVLYPNGLGSTTGDALQMTGEMYLFGGGSSGVYFVDSVDGNASNSGTDRRQPLVTIAAAVAAGAAGDIIVCLSGHAETITSTVALTTRVLIGEGSSGGNPTVKLTLNHATNDLLTLTSGLIGNIWFEEPAVATTGNMIAMLTGKGTVRGCYFEVDETTNGPALLVSTDGVFLENNTFISTATDDTDPPLAGVSVSTTVTDLWMRGNVFSGGTVGFAEGLGFDQTTQTVTRMVSETNSLLLGAHMETDQGSVVTAITVGTHTGASKVLFP